MVVSPDDAVVGADQRQCRAELINRQAECLDVGVSIAADVDRGLALQVLVLDAMHAVVPLAFEGHLVGGVLHVPHDGGAIHDRQCTASSAPRPSR